MKRKILNFITIAIILSITDNCYAWIGGGTSDFTVGDFKYVITSVPSRTVEIYDTKKNLNGVYVVPKTVEFNGLTFNVTSIGKQSLGDNVKNMTIPPSIPCIGYGAFYDARNLETLIIEDCQESLDCTQNCVVEDRYNGQFTETKIKYLYLGRDITYKEDDDSYDRWRYSPFTRLRTFETIEIGKYVTNITHFNTSLAYNSNLSKIKCNCDTPPSIEFYSATFFSNLQYVTMNIEVPSGSISSYKSTEPWSNFINLKESEENSVKVTLNYNTQLGSIYINRQFIEKEITLTKGNDIEVNMLPASGKTIENVTVNGEDMLAKLVNNTISIKNIQTDIAIYVTFGVPQSAVRFVSSGGGCIAIPADYDSSLKITLEPETGWIIKSIFINDEDKTSELNKNTITLNNIINDKKIAVVFQENGSGIALNNGNNINIVTHGKEIEVLNANGIRIGIYDINGIQLYNDYDSQYSVGQSGIYIVKVGQTTFKVAIL